MQRLWSENRLDRRNGWVKTWEGISTKLLERFRGWDDVAIQTVADRLAFRVMIACAIERRVFAEGGPILEDGSLHPALRKNGYGSYANGIGRDMALLQELASGKPDNTPSLDAYLAGKKNGSDHTDAPADSSEPQNATEDAEA